MVQQRCCIRAVRLRSKLRDFFQGRSLLLLSVCLPSDAVLLILRRLKLHRDRLLGSANSFLWALTLAIEVLSFLRNLRWRGSCAFLILATFFALADSALREHNINCQLKHVLNHSRKQLLKQLARLFEARIRVHLNEPAVEVLIQDEVIPKELEAELSAVWINGAPHCVESLQNHLVHLWHQVIVDQHARLRVVLVYVVLESREAELVSVLEVTVVLCVLLHSIVCEVNEGIVDVLKVDAKLCRRRPQVALFEEEELVFVGQQDPDTDVELALVDQQRLLDVLLDDEGVVFYLVLNGLLGRRGLLHDRLLGTLRGLAEIIKLVIKDILLLHRSGRRCIHASLVHRCFSRAAVGLVQILLRLLLLASAFLLARAILLDELVQGV